MKSVREIEKKDPNYVLKVERAIKEKYGDKAIQHPANSWNEEKEKIFLEQIHSKQKKSLEDSEMVEVDGFLISKKLLIERKNIKCSCEKDLLSSKDKIYMLKYGCCYMCYQRLGENKNEKE